MITEDVKIIQEIFQLIDSGIAHGYDAFHYGVEWGEGYIETVAKVNKSQQSLTMIDAQEG